MQKLITYTLTLPSLTIPSFFRHHLSQKRYKISAFQSALERSSQLHKQRFQVKSNRSFQLILL